MKTILLSHGHVALVDDGDYEYLSQFRWWPSRDGQIIYASRNIKKEGRWASCKMHHEILQPCFGKEIDHIDRNGLNNQRDNLRLVSRSQNRMNSVTPGNKCGYKGVVFDNRGKRKPFWARLRTLGKVYQSGYFYTAKEAAAAYNKMAIDIFGKYALLNEL